MFTIIGSDGKEYGPAPTEQIRAWLLAGRANLDTQAKVVGSEEWQPLGDYPEFSPSPGAVPPPIEGVSVVGPKVAERGSRLFARLIDWIIRTLLTLPGALLIGAETMRAILQSMSRGELDLGQIITGRVILGAVLLLLAMGLLLGIQIWLLSTRGQSLGKLIAGIRIVRHPDGLKVGFVRAWLLREFVPALLGLVPVVGPVLLSPLFTLVDALYIFREDRRCIHDLIAGTKVVEVEPQPTSSK
jgi:uncharacterized RDD family membrane protein YckC